MTSLYPHFVANPMFKIMVNGCGVMRHELEEMYDFPDCDFGDYGVQQDDDPPSKLGFRKAVLCGPKYQHSRLYCRSAARDKSWKRKRRSERQYAL